jgi:hypothetical protein
MRDKAIAWPVYSQHTEILFSINESNRIPDYSIRELVRGSLLAVLRSKWSLSCNEYVSCEIRKGYKYGSAI